MFSKEKRVKLIASLPCYLEENVNAQRGENIYLKSIASLKELNKLGYGKGAGLELFLVYNPGGPFLPASQEELETDYRRELKQQNGIDFNRLLTITNIDAHPHRRGIRAGGSSRLVRSDRTSQGGRNTSRFSMRVKSLEKQKEQR